MIRKYFAFIISTACWHITMAQTTSPLLEVASFGKNQPIGVTNSGNRLFVSFPHHEPFLYGLTEIIDGQRVPYPNKEWNAYKPDQSSNHFINVQDLYADGKNYLWVLDSSPASGSAVIGSGTPQGKFKLIKINLGMNKVERVYKFDDLPKNKSALNDVCVDNSRQLAYLSDPGLKAIVILDLKTGYSRVVLQNDRSTIAQPGFKLHIDDKDVIDDKGNPFVSNVNGIALTHDDAYFYFRAINQTKLYRIETKHLTDIHLTRSELAAKVEMVAETGVCHGMIADAKGNIYLSNSQEHSIQYVTPEGRVNTLIRDDRLIWPDSFGIGGDGFLYLSCSQMNRLPKYNGGVDKTDYPYKIFKVKLP